MTILELQKRLLYIKEIVDEERKKKIYSRVNDKGFWGFVKVN